MSTIEQASGKPISFSSQALAAGLLASIVGFASTFALVIKALMTVGATQAEAASGLMALSIIMGLGGILLSIRTRMPVSVAWANDPRGRPKAARRTQA